MFRKISGGATHVGMVRSANEDALFVDADQAVWAVADGMGGHQRGDWASGCIVAALKGARLGTDLDANCDALADALDDANLAIFDAAEAAGGTIGSTVVMLHLYDGKFACLWSGDSRCYVLSRGDFRQLSRDHSQVEDMIAAGVITRAEAQDHPLGNVITRAIGVRGELMLDVVTGPVQDNDRFVLCSDGLTRCVSDAEIAQMLLTSAPQGACDALIALCLQRGAPDNVTVAVVACEQMTLAIPRDVADVVAPTA